MASVVMPPLATHNAPLPSNKKSCGSRPRVGHTARSRSGAASRSTSRPWPESIPVSVAKIMLPRRSMWPLNEWPFAFQCHRGLPLDGCQRTNQSPGRRATASSVPSGPAARPWARVGTSSDARTRSAPASPRSTPTRCDAPSSQAAYSVAGDADHAGNAVHAAAPSSARRLIRSIAVGIGKTDRHFEFRRHLAADQLFEHGQRLLGHRQHGRARGRCTCHRRPRAKAGLAHAVGERVHAAAAQKRLERHRRVRLRMVFQQLLQGLRSRPPRLTRQAAGCTRPLRFAFSPRLADLRPAQRGHATDELVEHGSEVALRGGHRALDRRRPRRLKVERACAAAFDRRACLHGR